MLQQCPVCYETTRCNSLIDCNHALCNSCKEHIKSLPGKVTLQLGYPCIECPICRKRENPPYHHIMILLRDSMTREDKCLDELTKCKDQLITKELEYRRVKHLYKLKIRRQTQPPATDATDAATAPVPNNANEPCDTCLKKTPRRCNVYGCRKHCCMNCVICKECEQKVTNHQSSSLIEIA